MPDFEIFTKLEKKIQNKYKKIMTILKFYYLKAIVDFIDQRLQDTYALVDKNWKIITD